WDGAHWSLRRTFGYSSDSLALTEDRSGRIWIGADAAALVWDGSGWTSYSGAVLGSAPVRRILQDPSGTMWLATPGGVARTNGATWKLYRGGAGLTTDEIRSMLADRQGRLWFLSSGYGLSEHEPDRVAPQTIVISQPPALSASRTVSFVFGA